MATTIIFNRRSMRAPMSKQDMGRVLIQEAQREMPDMAKATGLLAAGADTNIIDQHGFSALMWAVTKSHDELADAIIATSEPLAEEA